MLTERSFTVFIDITRSIEPSKSNGYRYRRNIHFHKNAEHKAKDFSVFAGDSKYGGYQCNATSTLTAAELKAPKGKVCKNVKGLVKV